MKLYTSTTTAQGGTILENTFVIGVNYWDSKSGTDMWKNWDPAAVEEDLAALEAFGVR